MQSAQFFQSALLQTLFPNRTVFCDFETLLRRLFSAGFIFTAIKLVESILKRTYIKCVNLKDRSIFVIRKTCYAHFNAFFAYNVSHSKNHQFIWKRFYSKSRKWNYTAFNICGFFFWITEKSSLNIHEHCEKVGNFETREG